MLDNIETDRLEEICTVLSLLGNDRRLLILERLTSGEIGVGDLARTADLSQSAVSQHLAKLRKAKIVETRRDAQHIYYSICDTGVIRLLETISELFNAEKKH